MTKDQAPQDAKSPLIAPSALNAGLGWIQTKERLPSQGDEVVALFWAWDDPSKGRCAKVCTYHEEEFVDEDGDAVWPPTHWIPMVPND